MGDTLTKEQRLAVENRGGKLLVSAAAGSGKTKVLVERLMGYILDPVDPANIDDFLIITYTNAAASELRGKIATRLSELISTMPQNRHLQHQMQRLYLAKISTVHGFCGDLLRQYAYRLDIPSDFRVIDEGECVQLQLKALECVLNTAYESVDEKPDFYAFMDSQGLGRDDRQIPEIILKVYNSARCHLNPEKWLDRCIAEEDGIQDAAQTPWGQYLILDLKQYINMQINAFNRCLSACTGVFGMEKPSALFSSTVSQLNTLVACNSWDEIINAKNIDFGRLSFPKSCSDMQLAEQMKAIRNACKEGLAKRLKSFNDKSEQVLSDLRYSLTAAKGLVSLVKDFSQEYDRIKRNRGVLDFGDLEHIALDLLYGRNRLTTTKVAKEFGDNFREVMVDEYQDSNEIQDAIFRALTEKRNNCFMVGDVKQSIYQFRLADPGIFVEKYNTYADVEHARPGEGRKVLLSHNFRSSGGVISAVNDIFSQCMSTDVGGLYYSDVEMLREGIPHVSPSDPEVSLFGIDVGNDTYTEEAEFVANEICALLDGTHTVRDGDKLRPVQAEDIAILLRSPGSVGNVFQLALQKRGIRCVTGDTTDLFHTEEISTIRAILQIVNNPLQDIPLVSVLTSPMYGFTANDFAVLRSENRYRDIYHLVSVSHNEKCKDFIRILTELRSASRLMSVTELLSEIYRKMNVLCIYGAMDDGEVKCSNLEIFYQIASNYEATGPKDLQRFLEFVDALEDRGLSGASNQQEKGAVTIMSIHKSKGLEFPVVFLCGLSRSFNQESIRAQVLCHKDLGIGLDFTDAKLRVRYPTIAKRAVSTKIQRESISEEMRVLYVALTRARDRLIMTYATRNLAGNLQELSTRLDMCSSELLASEADCPGWWILQSALTRTEAGEFFELSCHPNCAELKETQWKIKVVASDEHFAETDLNPAKSTIISDENLFGLYASYNFTYPYSSATKIPSKLTATQLKGRALDQEISEGTESVKEIAFRAAGRTSAYSGLSHGNAVHAVLQHIRYSNCGSLEGIQDEIIRLEQEQLITFDQAKSVDPEDLYMFFNSPFGKHIRDSKNVIREFKFSVLCDVEEFYSEAINEKILLQGVVDLALIEEDGITVLDFKTDYATEDSIHLLSEKYKPQVCAYANALTRIYQKPLKAAKLYFFSVHRYVDVI